MDTSAVNLVELIGRRVELKRRGRAWWGCCPFHGEKTPSFQVDPDKGLWHCFGCGKGGDALTFLMDLDGLTFSDAKARLGVRDDYQRPAYTPPRRRPPSFDGGQAAAAAAPRRPLPADGSTAPSHRGHVAGADPDAWKKRLAGSVPFADAADAVEYLQGRGIPPMWGRLVFARYHPAWYGKGPAIVFPIVAPKDGAGWELVAAQGRFLAPATDCPKAMTAGKSSLGVFATPGAFDQHELLITEAPIDALTLALCGLPAVALIGTNFPTWLPDACQGKRVLVALDRDAAGDRGAQKLCDALAALGKPVERLAPVAAKDWNEYLQQQGRRELLEDLAEIFPHLAGMLPER